MIVRPLASSDRGRWVSLWQGYLTFYKEDLPEDITTLTWQRLMDPMMDVHCLVAEDGGEVIGFAHYLFHPSTWSATGYCYLEDLFAAPEVRSKGVGRALIEGVYKAADARGADRVYWATQHDNETARKLYDRIGELTPFLIYQK